MNIKLPDHLVEKLCVLPETGEGYQRVKIATKNGQIISNLIVESCQNLHLPSTVKLATEEIEDVELDSQNDINETPKTDDKKMSDKIKLTIKSKEPGIKTVPPVENTNDAADAMPLLGGGGLLKILERLLPLLTQVPMSETKSVDNPFEVLDDNDFDNSDPAIQEFKNQGGCNEMTKLTIKLTPESAQRVSEIKAAVENARTNYRLGIMRHTFAAIQKAPNSGIKQAQAIEALDVLITDSTNVKEKHELLKAREAVLAGTDAHYDAANYRIKNVFASYVKQPNIRTAYTSLSTQTNEPSLMCPKGTFVWGYPVPMEVSKCRENCIDSRTDKDGNVTCAYANWLKHADSEQAVLLRLDTIRHPDNKENLLTLKKGERSHPLKSYERNYEWRMEDAKLYSADKLPDESIETRLNNTPEQNLGHHGETKESYPEQLDGGGKYPTFLKKKAEKVDRVDPDSKDTMGEQISKGFRNDFDDHTIEQMLDDEHFGLTDDELTRVLEMWIEDADKVNEEHEKKRDKKKI